MIHESIKIIKDYFYVVFWLTYFWIYYFFENNKFFDYINNNVEYWELLFSYINAVFAAITIFWLSSILIFIVNKILKKISSKTQTEIDELLFDFIIKFLQVIKYIVSFYVFSYIANLPEIVNEFVDKITSVLVIIVFLVLLTQLINLLFKKELILKSKLKSVSKTLTPVINKVVVVFIWIIWSISIISNLWYDVSALVAWAWIWWLAIALAAQKSLTNVFWAVTILLNKPFVVWDFININGHIWVVKEIWLSYLTIQDTAGHQVMMPNENIISSSIENYSVRKNRRTDFSVWLVYWTSLDKMREWVRIIEEILQKLADENTIDTFRVNFDMFWDFSLNINATYFSLINDDYTLYLKQKEEINLEIKNKFANAWLDMAFPTRELIIKNETKKEESKETKDEWNNSKTKK